MKHNWTYKKLGEVGQVITGSTPTTKDERNYSSKDVCFFKPSDLSTAKLTELTSSEFYISSYAYEHSRKLPKDSVLTTCIGIIGKVGILTADATCNQQINAIIPNKDIIVPRFLGYSIISIKSLLSERANAPVVPLLNKSQFSSIEISIPSLSEQQSIVAELDAINHLIDLQEQQLREYDRLAQSLFYTTFGDPATNPKGWEVKKLGEICDVRDGTHDSPQYLQQSEYLLITSKNIVDGKIDFASSTNYISKEDYEAINKRSKVDVGDIIMPMIGTIGNPIIIGETKQKYCIKNVALIKFTNISDVVNIYVKMLLDTPSYMEYIHSLNKGGTQKFIALGTIRQLSLPLPPLSLQQSFAAQIEAIEQQKALIRRSLEDTRTLLAARMQYYFE